MSSARSFREKLVGSPPTGKTTATDNDPDLDGLYACVIDVHACSWHEGKWECVGATVMQGRRYWIYGDTQFEFQYGAHQAYHHAFHRSNNPDDKRQRLPREDSRQWIISCHWPNTMPDGFVMVAPFIPFRFTCGGQFYLIEPSAAQMTEVATVMQSLDKTTLY